jgi:D-3-phosphoglycerate dehydrogenase
MKILANDGISALGKQILEENGYIVLTDKVPQNEVASFIQANQIDMLLVRSATTIRKEIIDTCPSLKLLGRGGVGMDNIDVAYAREKGLHVINTPAASSQSVAELVIGHFFAGARFLNRSFKDMATGDFNTLKKDYAKGIELRGKTLTIVGFGKIGQALAGYAIGCGMNVKAVTRTPRSEKISLGTIQGHGELFTTIETTDQLHPAIQSADFISIHVPKQNDSKALIGKEEFALMKKCVVLVNAARGGVVDELLLLEEIEKGNLAYVGLDVFENEPSPRKELLTHPSIGTTPHIGAATVEAQDRIGSELAAQIISIFGKK